MLLTSWLGWLFILIPLGLGSILLKQIKARSFNPKKAAIGALVGFFLPYLVATFLGIAYFGSINVQSYNAFGNTLSEPTAMLIVALFNAVGFTLIFGLYQKGDISALTAWLKARPKRAAVTGRVSRFSFSLADYSLRFIACDCGCCHFLETTTGCCN